MEVRFRKDHVRIGERGRRHAAWQMRSGEHVHAGQGRSQARCSRLCGSPVHVVCSTAKKRNSGIRQLNDPGKDREQSAVASCQGEVSSHRNKGRYMKGTANKTISHNDGIIFEQRRKAFRSAEEAEFGGDGRRAQLPHPLDQPSHAVVTLASLALAGYLPLERTRS